MTINRLHQLPASDYALAENTRTRLFSPALLIFLDHVRHNLRTVLALMRDKGGANRWRPHLKTAKIPEVYTEIVRAGLHQFKCATPREAAVMLAVLEQEKPPAADLLVAYPHRSPALERIAALAEQYPRTRVSVLCEDPEHLDAIPLNLGIFIDINPQMDRTGVALDDYSTIAAIARNAGQRLGGLHFYDGHLKATAADAQQRAAWSLYEQLLRLRHRLSSDGIAVDEIITSGTLTFLAALDYEPFATLDHCHHRVSPGTVVYHDVHSEKYLADLALKPAAVVFSRVISHPQRGLITCDAGSKSLAAEMPDPIALALHHPELSALRPSEEHLPLAVADNHPPPPRGEPLLLVPDHVCPTVNLAEQALLIESGHSPRAVAVAARAHELLWQR